MNEQSMQTSRKGLDLLIFIHKLQRKWLHHYYELHSLEWHCDQTKHLVNYLCIKPGNERLHPFPWFLRCHGTILYKNQDFSSLPQAWTPYFSLFFNEDLGMRSNAVTPYLAAHLAGIILTSLRFDLYCGSRVNGHVYGPPTLSDNWNSANSSPEKYSSSKPVYMCKK